MKVIAKLEEYNTFVNGLKDKKYDDVKFAWEKLYKGIRESDKIVQSNEIKAKSGLEFKNRQAEPVIRQHSRNISML